MSFIQDYRDLQGIARGVKKAERDIQRIKNHIIQHNVMHDLDELGEWDCHEFNAKFFSSLGRDVEHDSTEAVGYNRGREKYQDELLKDASASDKSSHPDVTVIPIEMDGNEGPEEIRKRVAQAIRDHMIFQEQVSETNQQNPDQKESK